MLGTVGAAVGYRSAGDEWWELHATDPDRSPNTLAIPESRLRLHVRPGSATADRADLIEPAQVSTLVQVLVKQPVGVLVGATLPQGYAGHRSWINRRTLGRGTAALNERMGRALAVAAYLLRERRDWRAVDGGEAV